MKTVLLYFPDLHFAEGGAHNSNKLESPGNGTSALEVSSHHNLTGGNNVFDLLADGAPSTGTSGIKPRKGVHLKLIVPRKGAPPCVEGPATNMTEGLPCPPLLSTGESEDASPVPPPVYEQAPDVRPTSPKPAHTSLNKTDASTSDKITPPPGKPHLNNKTMAATTPSPLISAKKPTVTVVPADSEELLKALKNDRNVVIPVAALICAPLLVLLMLFVYKRIQDSRGNSHYTRMGFLIEDIYND